VKRSETTFVNEMNLKLRKIEPSDLPFLYQWENDATMWADSDTHNPLSRHDLHQYIENTTGDIYRDGQLRLIIEESQLSNNRSSKCETRTLNSQLSTKIVGCIDLFDFDARNRKAAIGMYIAPHARGNGVGKQAVQLLLDYAFGHLQLRMLYAIISVHNTPCSHIYEQMGFTASSVLQDWTLEGDAILWQKLNK
jgi:diamine N-acetyltransferase